MPRSSFFDGDQGDPVDPPALAPEPVGDGSSIPSSFYERNLAQDAAAETECEANAAAAANSATAAANSSTSAAASAGSAAANATAAGVSSAGSSAAATAAAGSASNASTSAGAASASAALAATSATNAASSASSASSSAAAAAATGVEVDADEAAAAASATAAAASAAAAAALVADGDKGDVIVSSGGTVWQLDANTVDTAELVDSSVTNAKLANMVASTIKGRISTTGAPQDLTAAQITALLNLFDATHQGLAPSSGGGTTNFLRADGSWAAPPGGGGGGGGSSYPHSVLLGATTYYIRTTGNDTTGNGSLGNPWLTIDHAMNALDGLDFNSFAVIIDVGPGTFGGWGYRNFWGAGAIIVRGAGPASTTITAGPNDGVFNFGETICQNAGGSGDVSLSISEMTLGGTGYAHIAIFTVCAQFALWDLSSGPGNIVFDLTGGQVLGIWVLTPGSVLVNVYVNPITFKGGNAQYGMLLETGAFFTSETGGATGIIFTGTPNFTSAFIHCDVHSGVDVGTNLCPISGAYTGKLYELGAGCYISVNGSPGWTYNGTASGGATVALSPTDSETSFDKVIATGHAAFGSSSAVRSYSILDVEELFTGDLSLNGVNPGTNGLALDTGFIHTGVSASTNIRCIQAFAHIDASSTGPLNSFLAADFYVANAGRGSISNMQAFRSIVDHQGSGTLDTFFGVYAATWCYTGGGTINHAAGFYSDAFDFEAGASIGTYSGVFVATGFNSGATITNNYGLYVQDQSGIGSSESLNIKSVGGRNLFSGAVGIGNYVNFDKIFGAPGEPSGDEAFIATPKLNVAEYDHGDLTIGGEHALMGLSYGARHTGSGAAIVSLADNELSINTDSTGPLDFATGLSFYAANLGSGDIGEAGAFAGQFDNFGSSGLVSLMYSFKGTNNVYQNVTELAVASFGFGLGGGNVATGQTLKLRAPQTIGGTATNVYGVLIEDHSGIGSVASENIHSAGANSLNLFEGTVKTRALDVTNSANLSEYTNSTPAEGDVWWDGRHLYFQKANSQSEDLLGSPEIIQALSEVLVEQRLQNLLLAEGLEIHDDLDELRTDIADCL